MRDEYRPSDLERGYVVSLRIACQPAMSGESYGVLTDLVEVVKLHQVIPLTVMIPDQLQDLCLLQLESQSPHGDFQLVVVDCTIVIGIKQIKRLFDLLLLLLGQLTLLLTADRDTV